MVFCVVVRGGVPSPKSQRYPSALAGVAVKVVVSWSHPCVGVAVKSAVGGGLAEMLTVTTHWFAQPLASVRVIVAV